MPQAAASAPLTGRPRSSSSLARATPTSRGSSQVAPLSGVKPRLTKGSQNRLSSAATVKSEARAIWHPSPAAQPCTAHTTGSCISKSRAMMRCAWSGVRRCTLPVRGFSPVRVAGHPVGAGAEVVAGAREHDDPQRVVGRRGLEGLDDAPDRRHVERALALGPVDDDAQHALVGLDHARRRSHARVTRRSPPASTLTAAAYVSLPAGRIRRESAIDARLSRIVSPEDVVDWKYL